MFCDVTFRWSIGHHLVKLRVWSCKACEYLDVVCYVSLDIICSADPLWLPRHICITSASLIKMPGFQSYPRTRTPAAVALFATSSNFIRLSCTEQLRFFWENSSDAAGKMATVFALASSAFIKPCMDACFTGSWVPIIQGNSNNGGDVRPWVLGLTLNWAQSGARIWECIYRNPPIIQPLFRK